MENESGSEIKAYAVNSEDDDKCERMTEDDMDVYWKEEERLSHPSTTHGKSYASNMSTEIAAMLAALTEVEKTSSIENQIDTCAKRSSVMSLQQYRAY